MAENCLGWKVMTRALKKKMAKAPRLPLIRIALAPNGWKIQVSGLPGFGSAISPEGFGSEGFCSLELSSAMFTVPPFYNRIVEIDSRHAIQRMRYPNLNPILFPQWFLSHKMWSASIKSKWILFLRPIYGSEKVRYCYEHVACSNPFLSGYGVLGTD